MLCAGAMFTLNMVTGAKHGDTYTEREGMDAGHRTGTDPPFDRAFGDAGDGWNKNAGYLIRHTKSINSNLTKWSRHHRGSFW